MEKTLFFSKIAHFTPSFVRSMERTSPTGPAPIIKTGRTESSLLTVKESENVLRPICLNDCLLILQLMLQRPSQSLLLTLIPQIPIEGNSISDFIFTQLTDWMDRINSLSWVYVTMKILHVHPWPLKLQTCHIRNPSQPQGLIKTADFYIHT